MDNDCNGGEGENNVRRKKKGRLLDSGKGENASREMMNKKWVKGKIGQKKRQRGKSNAIWHLLMHSGQ